MQSASFPSYDKILAVIIAVVGTEITITILFLLLVIAIMPVTWRTRVEKPAFLLSNIVTEQYGTYNLQA